MLFLGYHLSTMQCHYNVLSLLTHPTYWRVTLKPKYPLRAASDFAGLACQGQYDEALVGIEHLSPVSLGLKVRPYGPYISKHESDGRGKGSPSRGSGCPKKGASQEVRYPWIGPPRDSLLKSRAMRHAR
jgi:hypothetical protein